nr:facilitated trehalose transporter Tret1-2 homolog [Maniola hyperantus]
MCPAVQIAVSTMVLTEYTSPKYRGMFISFQGATVFWGIWVSNAIGTFYHWKNIGILIFVCCIYSISILFWPESPVWLAAKGRFEECAKSHRWLKGEGKDSEEELKQLIIDQKKNSTQERKLACTGYVIEIIKSISENESTAYVGMLVLDGVTVLGMYTGVFLTNFLKRQKQIKSTNITKSAWIYLIRQIFICSGVASYFFLQGLFFGAPTVYIPQIRKEANSTDIIGMEMVSWLYSISSYGSLIWSIMIPLIAEGFGRKVPFIIAWVNTMVCVLLFYCSTSVTELLVSALLLGILPSVLIAMSIMILTEYTSPRYRGVLITFKGATFYWGIWVSNAIGTFFHWKNIGILIFICCIYNISILFWPESPFWLASKGNFVECAKWHRWLKGEDKDSEEELMQLLTLQKELKRKQEGQKNKLKVRIVKQYNIMKAKRFYKPFIFAILTICLYHFSGKMACAGYVLDIIKTITVSESTAYEGMLVLDGVTVFGMYIGVCLNKFLKRRTLFLGSSTIGVTFLFILSLYLYLVHLNVVAEKKYLTLFLLTGFSVSISCGPMIMSMCFCSELTPLKGEKSSRRQWR